MTDKASFTPSMLLGPPPPEKPARTPPVPHRTIPNLPEGKRDRLAVLNAVVARKRVERQRKERVYSVAHSIAIFGSFTLILLLVADRFLNLF